MAAKMVTAALLHPVHRPPTSFLSYLNPYHHHRRRLSSSPATRYPLYYDLILSRPPPRRLSLRNHPPAADPTPPNIPFENWADRKISDSDMDKPMRKYYSKRRKRMFGSDSDDGRDGGGGGGEKYIELKPEVVELPTYHAREEELYFYDAFALPWEKDKHYRMVYQLEKKYFPDQCLDKAFVDTSGKGKEVKDDVDKRLVFFDEKGEEKVDCDESVEKKKKGGSGEVGVTEKKVEEFFKCLKTVPGDGQLGRSDGEPFLASKRTGLPPRWDGPFGTVVLVNKPKGWTSFTVCGKLRRLVKVQKVGHTGTLDPMATGLLIVCIGKATKLVERYQGMVKGYSGVFRLGEATSTWDADSPVIQREPWEHIKDEEIKKAAATFSGEIWQVPPMFSAIKVGGEKMYEKARRGETVELSPRRVSICQFDIERSLNDRQNLIFRVICSKGTYIRSLCADFGKALNSCSHLTALRRDSIGEYAVDDAWDFDQLQKEITKTYL